MAEAIKSYRDLLVWQRGMDLAVMSYELTKRLPASEAYGLAGQIRRAAASIPANIAEGYGRRRLGDYLRYLSIAHGSLLELETHLLLACRLSYISQDEAATTVGLAAELGRMLGALTRKLTDKQKTRSGR